MYCFVHENIVTLTHGWHRGIDSSLSLELIDSHESRQITVNHSVSNLVVPLDLNKVHEDNRVRHAFTDGCG